MIQLHEGERVIAAIHRHWLPITIQSIALLILAVAPIVLEAFAYNASDTLAQILGHYSAHVTILEASWILIVWMSFAVLWTNHYLDVLIITNQRVIDIDQVDLFNRDLAELSMVNIEDIRIEVNGLLASWLKFGTLELQTAAESKSFIITNLQNPERANLIISKVHADFVKTQQETQEKA